MTLNSAGSYPCSPCAAFQTAVQKLICDISSSLNLAFVQFVGTEHPVKKPRFNCVYTQDVTCFTHFWALNVKKHHNFAKYCSCVNLYSILTIFCWMFWTPRTMVMCGDRQMKMKWNESGFRPPLCTYKTIDTQDVTLRSLLQTVNPFNFIFDFKQLQIV